jgi:hypothetical protein
MYRIYVNQKLFHKTKEWPEALKAVKEAFKRGHEDIQLSGGKIGYWR